MSTDTIGLIAGILTAGSLLPQLIKTLKERKVEGVSAFIFIILMAGTGLWVYYGTLRDDFPLIITNSFSFALNVVMLILKIRYSK
jgi:MtN3 and saliva related transmembrane protein